MAKKIGCNIDDSSKTSITGINNDSQQSVGIAKNVTINANGCLADIDFVVLHNAPTHVVLGISWFHEVNGILNFKKSQIDMEYNNTTFTLPFNISKQSSPKEHDVLLVSNDETSIERPIGLPSDIFAKYQDIFQPSLKPIQVKNNNHRIITTTTQPISSNPYRLSAAENTFIKSKINELLQINHISHSNSNWASPIILVKKKNGDLRLCVDYRKLNHVTVKDCYPLPHIDTILDQFCGSAIFSVMDLANGYWQVPIHEDDKHKTAFICQHGLFQWNVMPFGLCNAPATFQRLINNIFQKYLNDFVLIYMDDIIIYSKSCDEHLNHLITTFNLLRQTNVRLNP